LQLRLSAGLAAGLAVLALPAAAQAAPVTVQLRIEGPQHTLFEGPVTTDVRAFHFSGDATTHTCDGSPPAGTGTTPQVTSGAVLTAAEDTAGLVVHGTWYDVFGSPIFSDIGGENVAPDTNTNRYLVEYHNETLATGSCGQLVSTGDRVLYGYGTGSEQLLALSGPASARPDAPVTLRVTDAATGSPVAGAAVGGGVTVGNGTVTIGPLARGPHDEKATKDGAIRSNRVTVCVTDGADGACGTTPGAAPPASGRPVVAPDRTAPRARLLGLRDHQVFSRRRAPRVIRVAVPDDPSTVKKVDLRLTRQVGRRCWYFSGPRARFVRSRCVRRVFFSVPVQPRISFLLPRRLGRGRYVLDAVAIDGAGNRQRLARGVSRVVFSVR
jgi:hypothetical protein